MHSRSWCALSRGRVLDVAVDIRRGSPTFGRHVSVELSGDNKRQFFVPRGFAHGFSVLSDEAVFQYKCDNLYAPESEGAIAWDDPALGIDWHLAPGGCRPLAQGQLPPAAGRGRGTVRL